MGVHQVKVKEAVDNAVAHRWSIPEFQRGFVWRPPRVKDLAESLWRDYPIGSLLLWTSPEPAEPRINQDSQQPQHWVVDGQQRTTALSILFNRKPFWWPGSQKWDKVLAKYDVRFNPMVDTDPVFKLADALTRKAQKTDWIPVHKIVTADDEQLAVIVEEIRTRNSLPPHKFHVIWSRLDSVRKLRDKDLVVITVQHDIEDVVQIFQRVNSKGTKVTEADVFLALATSKNPGWARKEFLPFMDDLKDAGFDLDPNLIFRTIIAIGVGKTRFAEVQEEFWQSQSVKPVWKRCRECWIDIVKGLHSVGVLNASILPSHNALLPIVLLRDRFNDAFSFRPAFACFLELTSGGRYSGAALTTLAEDIRLIDGAKNFADAVDKIDALIPDPAFAKDHFLADARDEYFRLLLMYLMAYDRQACDWRKGTRIGFEGKELLAGFSPDWHHIFPRRYLEEHQVSDEKINALANMAVIDPKTNIRFGKKDPMKYLEKYEVSDEFLEQQLVPTDRDLFDVNHYDKFLEIRASSLSNAANIFFARLRGKKKGAGV